MAKVQNLLATSFLIVIGACCLSSCKPRSSDLKNETSEANVNRILDEFDPSIPSNVEGMLRTNRSFLLSLSENQRKDLFLRYRALTERDANGVPKYWDKFPIFRLNRKDSVKRGFVLPKSITYSVKLPNEQIVPVQILFQAQDILRSSVWIRNLVVQAASCYWIGNGNICNGQPIQSPAPKVRLAVSGDRGIIGFNFINAASDWPDALTSSGGEEPEPTQDSPAAAQPETKAQSSAAAQPGKGSGSMCNDLMCGVGSKPVTPETKAMEQLPKLADSALNNILGFESTQIRRGTYFVSGLNSSARNLTLKNEICYGDVFTVMDGPTDIVGSGFGMWLQDINQPCVQLANASNRDVLVFGKIGGQNRQALYQIAAALKPNDPNQTQLIEAEVVDVKVEAGGNEEDLTTFAGDLYQLSWDPRGLSGSVSVEGLDLTNTNPFARYLDNATAGAPGRAASFNEIANASQPVTLMGSVERPEGREAISARSPQADQAEMQRRLDRIKEDINNLKDFKLTTSRVLVQALAALPEMRQENFVVFRNVKNEYQEKVGLDSGISLLEDTRFMAEYFLRLQAFSTNEEFQKSVYTAIQIAMQSYGSLEQLTEIVNGLQTGVQFMGMGIPYSKAFMDALTQISNSVKFNRNAIYAWNRPMFELVADTAINGKDMTLAEIRRPGGRGQTADSGKYLKWFVRDWLVTDNYRIMLKEMTGKEPPKLPGHPDANFLQPNRVQEIYDRYSPSQKRELEDYFQTNLLNIYATLDSVLIQFSEPKYMEIVSIPNKIEYSYNSLFQMSDTGSFRKCDKSKKASEPLRIPLACVYNIGGSRQVIGEVLKPIGKELMEAIDGHISKLALVAAAYGEVLNKIK